MTAFSTQLKQLRTDAKLTNRGLARLARVPESLISGLQNDKRRVGEMQARRLANALRLEGDELNTFVLQAINTSTTKVLNEAKHFPAELLNLLPRQLNDAGISAESICRCTVHRDGNQQSVTLRLSGDGQATLKTELITK